MPLPICPLHGPYDASICPICQTCNNAPPILMTPTVDIQTPSQMADDAPTHESSGKTEPELPTWNWMRKYLEEKNVPDDVKTVVLGNIHRLEYELEMLKSN